MLMTFESSERSVLSQLLEALWMFNQTSEAIRKAMARYATQVDDGEAYYKVLDAIGKANQAIDLAIEDVEARSLAAVRKR